MLVYNQAPVQAAAIPRRCISYTDLASGLVAASGSGPAGHGYDSSSDSDGENPQPIKRSRSDQSLSATAALQLGGAGRSSSSGSGGGGAPAASQAYGSLSPAQQQQLQSYGASPQHAGASYMHSQFARGQRAPSLPVVLSDVGSSTNSLLSLDSEVTRSASQQHLRQLESSAAAAAAAAAPRSVASSNTAAAAAAANAAALNSVVGAAAQQHTSPGFVCSLNFVSSAASLAQAQVWSRGSYDMTRTTSDASLSSGGYSAALQQLGLPLADHNSPPLLLSPVSGHHSSAAAGAGGAGADAAAGGPAGLSDALRGSAMDVLGLGSCSAGEFKPGLSIQQQKQASFQGPPLPASGAAAAANNVVMTAALGSSSWGMRQVNSRDSLYSSESITSVEAGERLAGVRFGLPPRSSSLTPSPAQAKQQLQQQQALTQLPPLSPQYPSSANGAAAASSSAASAAAAQGGWGGSSSVTSPGFMSESESGTIAGASPAIELQSMGSVLGGDGQWLFGELSTGAIGALSPTGLVLRDSSAAAAGDQQQQGQQQQPTTSVAMAAPVPLSRAMCSLPLQPGPPSGAFGFGGFGAGAGQAGGAAAAAAAAKLCLFEAASPFGSGGNSSSSTARGLGMQSVSANGTQPAGQPLPRSLSNDSSSGNGNGWRGVSSPLPRMGSIPPRPAGSGGLMQTESLQQPYRPSQHDASQWSFARRHSSFDCARTSLSSRRRGSLELNMPWRKTLDAAIAAAESSSGAVGSSPRTAGSGGGSSSSSSPDDGAAADMAVGETEATFGSGAVVVGQPSWQRLGAAGTSSQLDLLTPLPEVDDETSVPSSCCGCGPGSIGPGSMGSGGGRPSFDADPSTPSSHHSRHSSSSGGSIAADHDLPGSTNIGGYIGGSDGLGLARHSLDSPTAANAAAAAAAAAAAEAAATPGMMQQQQHNSYGLEFDGAVMMEAVTLHEQQQQQQDARMQHSSSSLHSMQEQFKVVVADRDGQLSSSPSDIVEDDQATTSSDDEGDDDDAMPPLPSSSTHSSSIQQQQMAGKRAAPETSRKAAAAAAAAAAEVSNLMSSPASALGLDGPGLPFSDLQSFPSASSISSRGSPGLYHSRRGAGNGASRDLELFVRLNRARQTLDFAKRQAQAFAELDRAELTVWQAFDLLDGLHEFEAGLMQGAAGSGGGGSGSGGSSSQDDAALTPDMSLREHAFQVAELCRLSFPDKPWMALVGLLHGLGKLLAHPLWGSQPQWAVAGESFPVGCKFAPQISACEFFSANPDRRRRTYSTALGVYPEQCGLRNVYMSWGAPEYLYMLLVLNQTQLPEEALFMIRYQRCSSLTRPGGAYRQLMTSEDKTLLPTLAAFQHLLQYKRVTLPPEALQGQQLYDYYSGLINSYLGEEALFW